MAMREFNPIGNGNDMVLGRSGMSPEEIFGEILDEGFRKPARGLSRNGKEYIPNEDIPDQGIGGLDPETLMMIREGRVDESFDDAIDVIERARRSPARKVLRPSLSHSNIVAVVSASGTCLIRKRR